MDDMCMFAVCAFGTNIRIYATGQAMRVCRMANTYYMTVNTLYVEDEQQQKKTAHFGFSNLIQFQLLAKLTKIKFYACLKQSADRSRSEKHFLSISVIQFG